MRSPPIIQTAPEVSSVPMKQKVMMSSSAVLAPPQTEKVVATASRKPPIPVTFEAGRTRMIASTGIA